MNKKNIWKDIYSEKDLTTVQSGSFLSCFPLVFIRQRWRLKKRKRGIHFKKFLDLFVFVGWSPLSVRLSTHQPNTARTPADQAQTRINRSFLAAVGHFW